MHQMSDVISTGKIHQYFLLHKKRKVLNDVDWTEAFESLGHMSSAGIKEVLEKVGFDDIIIALAGTTPAVKETILAQMPDRLRHVAGTCASSIAFCDIPKKTIIKSMRVVVDAMLSA